MDVNKRDKSGEIRSHALERRSEMESGALTTRTQTLLRQQHRATLINIWGENIEIKRFLLSRFGTPLHFRWIE